MLYLMLEEMLFLKLVFLQITTVRENILNSDTALYLSSETDK